MAERAKKFEGYEVIGTKVAIKRAGDGLSASLAIDPTDLKMGQRVFIVMEAEVGKVSFVPVKDTKNSVQRTHDLLADTVMLVDAELVKELIEKQRIRLEEAAGVVRLSFIEGGGEGDGPARPEGMSDAEWEASLGHDA